MTEAPVTLRDAVDADLPSVRGVYRRSALVHAEQREDLLARPDLLQLDESSVAAGCMRVALSDEQVVGFAIVRGTVPDLELEDLFVDPDWMRRGIGAALVRDAAERAGSQGARRILVTANPQALAFYERAGFTRIGERQTTLGPAPRMALVLTSPPPSRTKARQ